ncbi:MAG: asparagine synthase (glutamine-hydrolyzing) [Gemmataceae bacterium]
MCGIAGIIDLTNRRSVPTDALDRMAEAIWHRGPDEYGILDQPGIGFVSRRLSIVGLADGQQPISNEDGTVTCVYNGELFDFPEKRKELEGQGHVFRTHCDTELIPHLWEDHGEGMFDHLEGQYALALWDEPGQQIVLGRDRFGICPLYWTRESRLGSDWLVFASEIKGLLASGLIDIAPDVRGIDQVFNFFAIPGPASCFKGIQSLLPGHYIKIGRSGHGPAQVEIRKYWEIDFPRRGEETRGQEAEKLADEFQEVLYGAVQRRLRADVPVVSYLSGGIDSSIVVAMAKDIRGESVPTFTIQILDPKLDERAEAAIVSRHVGADPVVVQCGHEHVLQNFQKLLVAAETPVVDTSCTAMMLMAEEVHRQGYKAALTGEGSDEWLAGYTWFKVHKLVGFLDQITRLPLAGWARTMYAKFSGLPKELIEWQRTCVSAGGGPDAFQDVYGLMRANRYRFYSESMLARLADYNPYEALEPNLERVRHWHPLNRGLYWGGRLQLAGLLLKAKGDRVAMRSSVETRYPFLDKKVFDLLAPLDPSWKLRGFREKYILRLMGQRWLPKEIAWAKKGMFRAPLDSFFLTGAPPYVDRLLSEEALEKTGYFDPAAVKACRARLAGLRVGSYPRTSLEMGLVAVVATQLWHHSFIDPTLADLPDWKTLLNQVPARAPRVA